MLDDRIKPAGMKGVTLGKADEGHPEPLDKTMFLQRLNGIMRTGGMETTGLPQKGGDAGLIQPDSVDQDTCQHCWS